MRHAEASWDAETDRERPLSERGAAAACLMGETIASRGCRLQLIVSSPAKRALQTATLFAETPGVDCEVVFDERIYEADRRTLLEIAARLSDALDSVMLVGHNPGFEEFASVLAGSVYHLSAGDVAWFELEKDSWEDMAKCGCKLVQIFESQHFR
jgi:phosphohistidine phosphatase